MKLILVIFEETTSAELLRDERPETIDYLMSVGAYGRVAWDARCRIELAELEAMIDRLAGTTIRLAHGSAAASEIDQTLGSLLESQTDEVALLLLAIPRDVATVGDDAYFILAAANSPLAGELENIAWRDLPPTLLALGEQPIPPAMAGRPLAAPLSAEEMAAQADELARERLRGLGYIE